MMSEPIWSKYLTARDKQVFAMSGYGQRAGFGKRPALLIIDVVYDFCGDKREPITESIKRWRNSCGEDAWDALPVLQEVISAARVRGVPVIYTTDRGRLDNWDRGSWAWKNNRTNEAPRAAQTNQIGNEIMPQIAPAPQDIVLYKSKPSGFHGTELIDYLTLLRCDSTIICGATTSGCVRATAVDSFSYNYRTIVVEDGCFDRAQVSHSITLCDLHAKYADVLKSVEVVAYLSSLSGGMFELPSGTF
jgi:nicotinamidase-related amidase